MKNYPNQASSFERVRSALQTIEQLNTQGLNSTDDGVLGYAAARSGAYTFRGLPESAPTSMLDARIVLEQQKANGSQGARTFARELRRTLRDMGWLDPNTQITSEGTALLISNPRTINEQALLVEGLMRIEASNTDGTDPNHPILALLRLLAHDPSLHRVGLELALEPTNDGPAELARIIGLYDLTPAQRIQALNITDTQRANAVKIFPSLAVYAGLVLEEDGLYSLSQDGWRVLGLPAPAQAGNAIRQHRGRRTTAGRLVNGATVGRRRNNRPPRTLSPEEQARAAARLAERTDSHQALVRRVYNLIGDGRGTVFEDEFSYDLVWIPDEPGAPVILFEMKSVTDETDAYARIRHAVGQLIYYEYFNVAPTVGGRHIRKIAAFDSRIPAPLVEYLTELKIGALVYEAGADADGLNLVAQAFLDFLLPH